MKFETVRKMEETIKGFTSLDQLEDKITVTSQGTILIFEKIGPGSVMGEENLFYMCNDTADSLRIIFETVGTGIKVTNTKLSRV